MKKDRYKLRVIALLIAVGFVGGLFVQYKAPGTLVFARDTSQRKKIAVAGGDSDELTRDGAEIAPQAATGAPPAAESEAQRQREEAERRAEQERREQERREAERRNQLAPEDVTPALLRRYAAIAAVVGNTLEIAGPGGEKRDIYFAPRGVVADFGGGAIVARLWATDDDHLCRSLDGYRRECFYLVVHLNEQMQQGAFKTLPARVDALKVGDPIGAVEGMGAQKVKLLRGNVFGLPGYVPLLEGKPGPEWTADAGAGSRGFVGALLLRHHGDDDRAATFFAPNGQVFEVSRLTRETVSLWIGSWRRLGDLVCRQPTTQGASPRDNGDIAKGAASVAGAVEECAHARVADGRVEFPEAGPTRRAYIRSPWADEDLAGRAAAQPPANAEVNLAPPTRSRAPINASATSFTDLR
jgi:hypothetical protein